MYRKILLRLWHSQPLHLVDSAQLTEGKGLAGRSCLHGSPAYFQ
jgi:hypothetical protein